MALLISRDRWIFLLGIMLGFLLLPTGHVFAQESFPSRPLEFVVPLPPGGVADLHARALAPVLERILKQPVEVINKPGSVSKVGTQYVLSKKPDGHTLLLAMPSFFSAPEVDRLLNRPVAFKRDQFTPLARLSALPSIVFVRTSSPWMSFADLVADAKRRPDQIKFSTPGVDSTPRFFIQRISEAAGIKLLHVPYKGGGPAMAALLGGHVDMTPSTATVGLRHVKAGSLRALAVMSAKRIPEMPEVPTLKELGYDVEVYLPASVVVRKDTPARAIQILTEAIRQAAESPEFTSAMAKAGTPVDYLGGQDLEKFWKWQTETTIQAVESVWKTK